ncbi:nicotinamide-nucleotide adenylyltransferase, NadR type [Catalinimonas alkaloidigena]|uniref:Nicotinamide-nucleotide adenylyltransferase, NadR type n=1 Tax=Catalinimonas alkaloidigena TaxID=1075417 RepID=A0A1G9DDS6_9BACT|nr:ATP-binding protein [Catalinimonas alkaloidigena]SDK61957.1 nicotinamide-nucleotide adenylyltransferase, NadR type [Catalinimonas alkaloidigena]
MIRVALVGPESTGKSTLAAQLAAHYQTVWVPEYAREYLARTGRPYTQQDVARIGRGQMALEAALAPLANRVLVCDTNLLVIKIWMEHAYRTSPRWVAEYDTAHMYDLQLLMHVDLPWEADPQREHPHLRNYFFEWYQRELEGQKRPYQVISGTAHERYEHAIRLIDALL